MGKLFLMILGAEILRHCKISYKVATKLPASGHSQVHCMRSTRPFPPSPRFHVCLPRVSVLPPICRQQCLSVLGMCLCLCLQLPEQQRGRILH